MRAPTSTAGCTPHRALPRKTLHYWGGVCSGCLHSTLLSPLARRGRGHRMVPSCQAASCTHRPTRVRELETPWGLAGMDRVCSGIGARPAVECAGGRTVTGSPLWRQHSPFRLSQRTLPLSNTSQQSCPPTLPFFPILPFPGPSDTFNTLMVGGVTVAKALDAWWRGDAAPLGAHFYYDVRATRERCGPGLLTCKTTSGRAGRRAWWA